jgi:hypothetical protein
MGSQVPHHIKQAHPNLPPHIQLGIAQQQPRQPQLQGPQGPHVPRPRYVRRIVRAVVFGFLTFMFMAAAIASYVHAHRTGYAPLAQASPATGHYPNPLPFLLAGVFFGLLAFFQVRRIFKVRKLRRQR